MRAAKAAKALQLVQRLVAEQVLDGMEHGAGVRLHGNPVLRPKDVQIKRAHDGSDRCTRGLMPADLQPVPGVAQVVRVVDGPCRQP